MLYYRAAADHVGPPPELKDFVSPGRGADLHEQTTLPHKVFGVCAPLRFAPPAEGWAPLHGSPGWEVASVGPFVPATHIKIASTWRVAVTTVGKDIWAIPQILTPAGGRGFPVVYGGPDYTPRLTPEQERSFALAKEIRVAIEAGTMPEVPVQARWAAKLLPLVYCLSEGSLSVVGMSEELIDVTLRVAAGFYELRG